MLYALFLTSACRAYKISESINTNFKFEKMAKPRKDTLPRVMNMFNYQHQKHNYETCTGKSMTIPGESFSIKDLVERGSMGLKDAVHFQAQWQEDADLDSHDLSKVQHMDPVDKNQINIETAMKIAETQQKIADERAQASEEALSNKKDSTPPEKKDNAVQPSPAAPVASGTVAHAREKNKNSPDGL